MNKKISTDSFIARMGGKKLLRGRIISEFPANPGRYAEVFGGAAWVILGAEKHAKTEVYNDLDGELVNLFRVVKFHLPELFRELEGLYSLCSRELFFDVISQLKSAGLTDIQRAARFLVRIKYSFGADERTFCCTPRNMDGVKDKMEKFRERFKNVVIENKPYDNLIKVYDRPDALFYCDPPYFGAEDYYDVMFTRADHERLREILGGIKGKFVLSYNDCEFVRNLYSEFNIIEVSRCNNLLQTSGAEKYKELIIKNF